MEQEYYQQGKLKAKQEQYQEAIANFSQAIQLNPSSAEYYYQRGLAYFNLGQLHPAVFDYNESIKLDSQSYLAYYGRALVKVALKNFAGALEDLENLNYLKLNYAPAHKLTGIIYRKSGDNYQATIHLKKAAKLFLDQKDADSCRACLSLIDKIKPPSEIASISPAESSTFNSNDFYNKILTSAEKGELKIALEDLDWMFKVASPDAKAYICRGLVYQKKGELQNALSDFTQAIRINPKNQTAYRNRGKLRLQLKDFNGAIADFNYALNFNPEDILLLLARADVYYEIGNSQKAIENYNQVIKIDSHCANAYEKRGKAYLGLEEMQNAIIDYQKASNIYFEQENWAKYRQILDFLKRIQSKSPRLAQKEDNTMKHLKERLYTLVGGYWEIAERLLEGVRAKYPQMSEVWYFEKVIADLENPS